MGIPRSTFEHYLAHPQEDLYRLTRRRPSKTWRLVMNSNALLRDGSAQRNDKYKLHIAMHFRDLSKVDGELAALLDEAVYRELFGAYKSLNPFSRPSRPRTLNMTHTLYFFKRYTPYQLYMISLLIRRIEALLRKTEIAPADAKAFASCDLKVSTYFYFRQSEKNEKPNKYLYVEDAAISDILAEQGRKAEPFLTLHAIFNPPLPRIPLHLVFLAGKPVKKLVIIDEEKKTVLHCPKKRSL